MTSSQRSAKRGKQEPRVLLRPKFDSEEDAHDAVDLAASCGQDLDPWQVLLVCITLASMGGRLAASEVGGLVARQNGKGGWLEAVAIWSLFETYLYGELPGRKNTTLWTAHELKTSDEAWARVKSLIEANPDLAAEVVTWNGGLTGTHIIELRDGSRLIFLARSKSSGRGFSPRRIIFDEAQELSALAFRAMMYATSAQGARRQLIFAGTVPSEENDSAIWTGCRDRGRAGKVSRLAWAEWTPEGSDDPRTPPDPTDWKARAWSNPALGSRILAETIDEEWEAAQADLEGFMRERLSVWPSRASGSTVLPSWADRAVELPDEPVVMGLGIAADLDATWLSLGAVIDAGVPILAIPEGMRVRVADRAWFVSEVARISNERGCPVAIDKKGPAAFLIPDLAAEGVALTEFGVDDFIQACVDLVDAIDSAAAAHDDDPDLNAAVTAAGWRYIGDRRVFGRKSGDISSLEAVAIALHAFKTAVVDVWGGYS